MYVASKNINMLQVMQLVLQIHIVLKMLLKAYILFPKLLLLLQNTYQEVLIIQIEILLH